MQERRKKIIEMMQKFPGISQGEIAETLHIDRSTVSRDLKNLSEELKIQNNEAWNVMRENTLLEIQMKKRLCEDRLKRLEKHPHQGSRWLEEWQKLVDKECRILGFYSPDRLLIKEEQQFDKDQADAAVDAVLKSIEADNDVIDITPKLPEPKKEANESA